MSTVTEPQRLRALERANAVRLPRARLKRRIAAGEVTVAEVLAACPPEAESWAISDVLRSQWRWGTARARKVLGHERIPENKPVAQLTDRQCRVIVDALRSSAAGEEQGGSAGREREPQGSRR